MWPAGKQTILTGCTLGYYLETCMLFCAVTREEKQRFVSIGTPQHISYFISVANEEETSWQLQNTSDALCCDSTRYRKREQR